MQHALLFKYTIIIHCKNYCASCNIHPKVSYFIFQTQNVLYPKFNEISLYTWNTYSQTVASYVGTMVLIIETAMHAEIFLVYLLTPRPSNKYSG